ncbi:uncharacterized protein G2W53_002797 [Senna tora]|uniref:Uncharacterized protein n=1 Tax=Senna tora TaxID=362788 RepID=A0A834XAH7_9FABA|nr:uncharacterized protein G2W53_002797 [Senna tora]
MKVRRDLDPSMLATGGRHHVKRPPFLEFLRESGEIQNVWRSIKLKEENYRKKRERNGVKQRLKKGEGRSK